MGLSEQSFPRFQLDLTVSRCVILNIPPQCRLRSSRFPNGALQREFLHQFQEYSVHSEFR